MTIAYVATDTQRDTTCVALIIQHLGYFYFNLIWCSNVFTCSVFQIIQSRRNVFIYYTASLVKGALGGGVILTNVKIVYS